jgi:hypothetical protein
MTAPWLSVIMPTYNGAAYLSQTLASIECQDDKQIEIIVIDDGSTDATLDILHEHTRRLPLRIIARQRLGNWVANTNRGLVEASAPWVSFLHQDDLWLPGRLQTLRRWVNREPQTGMFLHPSRYVDGQGHGLGVWQNPLPTGHVSPGLMVERLLVQNFIAVPAPLFARAAARAVGGLDESLWYTADWDFWLKLARVAQCIYRPEPLAAFRIHAESQTAQGIARAGDMRSQIAHVLEKHLPLWETDHPGRREIGRAARVSLEVNHALAACAYGDRPNLLGVAGGLLALGPAGWYRFFRDSRLVERVVARVLAKCYSWQASRALVSKHLVPVACRPVAC